MIKKLFMMFFLIVLFSGVGFSYSDNDIPTESLYSSSIFSFLSSSTQDITIDKSMYPVFVTSRSFVFGDNFNGVHRTSSKHLADPIISKLNLPNDADGKYITSFMKIYRISNGNAILERTVGIDPITPLLFRIDTQYRFDFYNYDACTYTSKHQDTYLFWGSAEKCRSQSGNLYHISYQKQLADEKLKAQEVKRWLKSTYKSSELKSLLPSMKSKVDKLKQSYIDCRDSIYIPKFVCDSQYSDYQKALVQYNVYVGKLNRNEAVTRKSWDSNFRNLDYTIQIMKNKNTYYKQKAQIINKPLYKAKTDNGQYNQTTNFISTMKNDLADQFKKTTAEIKQGQSVQLQSESLVKQMNKDNVGLSFWDKVLSFFIVSLFLGLVAYSFYRLPFLKSFQIYGYGVTGIIYLIYLLF